MAKLAKNDTALAPASPFHFDMDLPIPTVARVARTSDTAAKLAAMPVNASFLEPVIVPATITDPVEASKTFKELARSTSNRLSGAIRRFKKSNPSHDFEMRTVDDAILGVGVRVWRKAVTA